MNDGKQIYHITKVHKNGKVSAKTLCGIYSGNIVLGGKTDAQLKSIKVNFNGFARFCKVCESIQSKTKVQSC